MLDFTKTKQVWCRSTEEKILQTWEGGKTRKISVRDSVTVFDSGIKEYKLWNTVLIKKIKEDVYINISDKQEMLDVYCCHWNYNRRDFIISNTTKSRLNAFLDYYGFNSLEVHSSMKEWCVKHNGKELKVSSDSWYKLNFETKELEKYN